MLFRADRLIAIQRDDRSDIPWPGLWDLPGGGREGDESPVACALREVEEELGLRLDAGCVVWWRRYPSPLAPDRMGWFLAAPVTAGEVAAIRFGDEGQGWAEMPVADFTIRSDAVPHLRRRVRDWVASR